jgi:hypothetical protein
MQFYDIPTGDMNMMPFTELLIDIGYPENYCKIMGTDTAPLVTEAESAYRDLDATSRNAIQYTANHLIFPAAEGSFTGMGIYFMKISFKDILFSKVQGILKTVIPCKPL